MRGSRAVPRIWDTDWLVLRGLARLLRKEAGAHVRPGTLMVDLGCGDMPYADMMFEMKIDYRGADIGEGSFLKIDEQGRVPLADGIAGAVLSVQVLEHVRDLDSYCAEIRRLLRDDGVLLLSTHGSWLYHPHPEDHRRWTRTGLVVDLADRGLEVEEVHAIAGPLATTTLIRLTGFAFFLRRLPIIGAILASLLALLMNLRAQLEDRLTPAQIRDDNACVFLVRARKAAI
ncbi:MAG: methyltransferase domain-containing protein [Mesorhizobium sp.]|uniref:class I SAM-dependent methyltransferase n=3 Tax=Mesorhizobium TaxID=68287 RepID=UPI000FE76F8D|nr:MAG: methyltransferase domain-containing protein [Mesorhizobium sp.]RWH29004.1 MAG: methyltransferase domain-containing protein [Mesorhizobium sp.]RWH37058.1 MAG: methyltransferase domain-containing protein [Mesorhizobium sp.]RWH43672.1 MAG: methyltransferase domain-containing protein [Mesorhizobium sp.]RWI21464.1 MAG: methyltransferase domain-containing protein [Mesorhizobium sp.]